MKINELKLVYFSPTGTTRKVAMEIIKNIELKSVSFDFTIHKDRNPSLHFKKNDFALFGCPVYYGRVPKTFLEYFETLKGEGTPAALAVTYGCRAYDDALLELKTEVESRGFKVIGAAAFPAEHSLVRSIGLGRPNREDLKSIADYGIQLNRRLKQETSFGSFDIKVPGNIPYKKYGRAHLTPKVDLNFCTECKVCVKICPTGAVNPEKPKKINKKRCIGCLKCVRSCRQKARYVSNFKLKYIYKRLSRVCDGKKQADIFM